MLDNANVLLTAWDDDLLVGVARAITDFSYCCYVSDLAVRREYQHKGIGKTLIAKLRDHLSDEVMLLLVSSPEAMDYYREIGFEQNNRTWYIPRKR